MTLAAGTTVGISGFSNTRETPVFTLGVEQSALQAYAVQLCENAIYGCQGGATATLPVGQRFVIEQVSGRCAIGGSGDLGNAMLVASLNGQQFSYVLVGQLDGGVSNARVFNNLTRIYADGGVVDGLSLSGTGNESCVVASGRLVALPAPPFP